MDINLIFQIVLVVLSITSIVLCAIVLNKQGASLNGLLNINKNLDNSRAQIINASESTGKVLGSNISILSESVDRANNSNEERDSRLRSEISERLDRTQLSTDHKLDAMRESLSNSLTRLQETNDKKLTEIKSTVDDKLTEHLETTLSKSFETVSKQLEAVYKSMGEMQTLANGVGDLKKVLSNTKTRGILGEFQLSGILKEILSEQQYEENVATVPGSADRVEFAVKLPSSEVGTIYLPIDAKFPAETYTHLQDAIENGNKDYIDAARKELVIRLKNEAKDIHTKYIHIPDTTEFGIMFLPTEGLYAEACNLGMMEILQRDYHVTIAGPSTMAALLNSLQMGFRTLAIQKRSNEVWKILGEAKTQFGKFEDVLTSVQSNLKTTSDKLDDLVGTRTRAINRTLRGVENGIEHVEVPLIDYENID